jgi:hypothetical protein
MFIHTGLDSKISFQGVGNLKEEILLYITVQRYVMKWQMCAPGYWVHFLSQIVNLVYKNLAFLFLLHM